MPASVSLPSPVSAQAMSSAPLYCAKSEPQFYGCVLNPAFPPMFFTIFSFLADTLAVVFKKSLSYNRSEYKGVKLYVRFKLYIRY